MSDKVQLIEINADNWRNVIQLKVDREQSQYVADPSNYLLLCHYGEIWHPMAIQVNEQIIGFIMWAIDSEDNSGWIGGFLIDKKWQGKGFGKQAIEAMLNYLRDTHSINHFALSVQPENPAVHLYEALGFGRTGEWEDDELVMRFMPKN